MTDQTNVLSLRDINVHYGHHHAVKHVNLEVKPKEVIAMVGPSGAGKSTLLRTINMLEKPSSGSMQLAGMTFDIAKGVSSAELLKLRRATGMVFQGFNLFPHMSVLKNIVLPQMRVLGRSELEATEVAMGLLERVKLANKAEQYPARLSGGQQQRIAIARALALGPQVMLFDEPTSALDPELGLEVLAVMRELADEGTTMIVVTHEIGFAAEVANRVIVMADGAIIEEDTPDEVIRHPRTERTQSFFRAILDRH